MSLGNRHNVSGKSGLWIVTLGVLGLTGGFEVNSVLAPYRTVRRPMTIEYAIQDGSGAPKGEGGYTMYYRSDGASTLESVRTSYPKGTLRPTRLISLPWKKTKMNFDPETNLVFTSVMSPAEIFNASKRRLSVGNTWSACMAELIAMLGPGADRTCEPTGHPILGYAAWATHAKVGPPEQPLLFVTYLAPDLAWHLLQQDTYKDGVLAGRIIAVKVSLGPPPNDMFRVPKSTRIASVLDFGRAHREMRGLPVCNSCEQSAKRAPKTINQLPPVY